MLPNLRSSTPLALLALGVRESYGSAVHQKHYPYQNVSSSSTSGYEVSSSSVSSTGYEVTSVTISSATTITQTNCSTSEISITSKLPTVTSVTYPSESISITSKLPTVTSVTFPGNSTISVTLPSPTSVTFPYNTTTYVPTTISTPTFTYPNVTYPTITLPTFTTSVITLPTYTPSTTTPPPPPPITPYEPCPTTCSISAGTVNLFFWPTDNPYTYPPTYVNTELGVTFTSPSVYMVINTIYGTNSLGRAGPAATNPVFALDLNEVSTIVPGGTETRQLTLSDLGTNCPQSEAASVIATKAPDGRCDPSLAAPEVVRSWALPCNACGRLGLFDPPYAIPAISGGLVPTTVTTTPEQETTEAPTSTPTTVVTTTAAETGATSTTAAETSPTSTEVASTPLTNPSLPPTVTTETPITITSGSTTITSSAGTTPTTIATASAPRITGGLVSLVVGFLVSVWLM